MSFSEFYRSIKFMLDKYYDMWLGNDMTMFNKIINFRGRSYTILLLRNNHQDTYTWDYDLRYGPKIWNEKVVKWHSQFHISY